MRGVMILTPATLLAKVIGLFYKIPLLTIVGVEGMAYFLSAYHVYSLLFVLSAAGLPTALSLLVSRNLAAGDGGAVGRIFGVALSVFFLLGSLGTVALLLFADEIAAGLAMGEAAAALTAIAPALLLSAFTGAARGLFQGHGNMLPTALSEVTEAAGKLVFGILLARYAKGQGAGTPTVAAAAVFGITLGVALSALLLAVAVLLCRKQLFCRTGALPPRLRVLHSIWKVALPVTVSASVMSLVSLVDTVLISSRLQAVGFASSVANAMYSSYGNLAVPLYNLVPALLTPITLSLTPALSAAFTEGDTVRARGVFEGAVRLAALVLLPASLGLSVFAAPILSLLYVGQATAVSVAAPLLSLLAPALLPAVLIALTGAALQAANKASTPVFSMLVGALVKLLAEVVLLSVPRINIYGAPLSTLACNFTVLTLNLLALSRVMRAPFSPKVFVRPFVAALLAVASGALLYAALLYRFGAVACQILILLPLVAFLYLAFALLFGAVQKSDIAALPFGGAICRVLEKCNLLREVKNNDKRRKDAIYSQPGCI